jgi:hypothetical protein
VPDPRKEVLPVRLPNTSTRDIRMLNASLAAWRHGKKQGTHSSIQSKLNAIEKWYPADFEKNEEGFFLYSHLD